METHKFTLTSEYKKIDGRVVLLCQEFPISGIGRTTNEATRSLLEACIAYLYGKEIGAGGARY